MCVFKCSKLALICISCHCGAWYAFHTIAEMVWHRTVLSSNRRVRLQWFMTLKAGNLWYKFESPICYGNRVVLISFLQWYETHNMLCKGMKCIPMLILKSQRHTFSQTNNFSQINKFFVGEFLIILSNNDCSEPRTFIDLLILDVINRFIFGHGVLSYYIETYPSNSHVVCYFDFGICYLIHIEIQSHIIPTATLFIILTLGFVIRYIKTYRELPFKQPRCLFFWLWDLLSDTYRHIETFPSNSHIVCYSDFGICYLIHIDI